SIADDFTQLEATINTALHQYGIEVLQQIGMKARLNDLRQQSEKLYQAMAPETRWRELHQQWQQLATQRCNKLQQLLHEQSTLLTQSLLADDASASLIDRSTAQIPLTQLSEAIQQQLWLPRFDTWLNDTGIALQNQLQQQGIRSAPFRAPLEKFTADSAAQCTETVQAELVHSTAKPGNVLQRGAYRLSGWLYGVLPLAAASWAAYHLISAFNSGISEGSPFLGTNFAIHSLLLIAIAWLIPWLLHRQLKPSLSAAARKGIANGVEAASENLKNALEEVWSEVSAKRQTLIDELDKISSASHDD
ncbi:MAG: hypothetical protein GXP10_08385, partial [Gammaproteobacteria bacterium]|nr:hypothetical protein [Gammaproteobacteria bacterium]